MAPGKKSKSTNARLVLAPRQLFTAKNVVMGAGLLALTAFVSMVPWLLPELTELPEYQFELAELEVSPPHSWVPKSLPQEVLAKSRLPARVSLLDPELCETVAKAFAEHPWVEKVESVRITPNRTLRAELIYRVPVAFVETSQGLYAVDQEGTILPPADFPIERMDRLPRLCGVESLPTNGAGRHWGDEVVTAGAKLAALLAPGGDLTRYWERFDLRAIVAVSSRTTVPGEFDANFELETTGGSRILWGKPPGSDQLEPSVEQKLARLEQYLLRFGSFDAPHGPYRIDIRLFDAISLQPLRTVR